MLAGPKRSGKTTLLVWALGDPAARMLANDRLFAFVDSVEAQVTGMPTIMSVRAETVERFPMLGRGVPAGARAAQWSHHSLREIDDALDANGPLEPPVDVLLSPAQFVRQLGTAGASSASISALLFPEVVQEDKSELEPIDDSEAVRRLETALFGCNAETSTSAVSACVDTPGPKRPLAERLELLAAKVPCYHYRHGRDAFAQPLRSSPLAGLFAF